MKRTPRKIPRTVIALGFVSFFTDMSSEMIYPLLPLFLTGVLGASAITLGMVEGFAEAAASLLKVVSGIWTDRVSRRKPFVFAGYGLAGIVRPLIGLATGWPFVLAMRLLDRVGKGIRTSPRDALIADVVEPDQRGRAYGFHRMMDHGGAVVGPLVAALLLSVAGFSLEWVFLSAAVPAVIVMVVIFTAVKEPQRPTDEPPEGTLKRGNWRELGGGFGVFLASLFLFTLGNSTDAFILLLLSDAGIPVGWIAVLWSLHHVVKMPAAYFGGILSDRFGRRRMILAGWMVYGVIYLAFAFFTSQTALVVIFLAYGLYFGLVEPSEKAWVADLAPAHLRGTAMGFYHGTIGIAALPASLLFGALWYSFGAHIAFGVGAGLALGASALLLKVGDPARTDVGA